MLVKFLCVTFLICLQVNYSLSETQWVPPMATAAEMRNPYTWFWPYAIAISEGYRDYFIKAQQITNQLYTQAAISGALGGGLPGILYGRNTAGRFTPPPYMSEKIQGSQA